MRARYKRSLLGWFWSLLNPASTVLIYSLVFGVFFQTPPPETANGNAEIFSIYLFTGFITWGLFQGIVNGSMDWLTGVMDLRKKVFFPTETAIFGGAIAAMVQTLFEIALLLVIMIVVVNISWTFLLLPAILLMTASFAVGIGLVLAILNARFRDVRYLTSIALSLQFFLAPIVYDSAILDSPTIETYGIPAKEIVLWNPVSLFVQAAHDVIYFLEPPELIDTAAMLAYAVVSPVLGLAYFRKRSMEISEEL